MISIKELRVGVNIKYKGKIILLTKEILFDPSFDIELTEPIVLSKDFGYELGFVDFIENNGHNREGWLLFNYETNQYVIQINELTHKEMRELLGITDENKNVDNGHGVYELEPDNKFRNPNGHCCVGIYHPEEKVNLPTEDNLGNMVTMEMSMVNFIWKIRYVHEIQNLIHSLTKKELVLYASTLKESLGVEIKDFKEVK